MNGKVFVLAALAVALGAGLATAETVQERLMSQAVEVARKPLDPVEFELKDLDGVTRTLGSYRGKVVFLNFWATWCGPCRSEMPSMQRVHEQLRGEGLQIVAVNLQESNDQVRRFMKELGLDFTVLMDRTGMVGAQYGARSIPTTYLIDRNGKIFARAIGAREWDTPEMIATFRTVLKDGVSYEGVSLDQSGR